MFELLEKFILDESKARFILLEDEVDNNQSQHSSEAKTTETNATQNTQDNSIKVANKIANDINRGLDNLTKLVIKSKSISDDFLNGYLKKLDKLDSGDKTPTLATKIKGSIKIISDFINNNLEPDLAGQSGLDDLLSKWENKSLKDLNDNSEEEFDKDVEGIANNLKGFFIQADVIQKLNDAKSLFDIIYNQISVNSEKGIALRSPAVFDRYKNLLIDLAENINEFNKKLQANAEIENLFTIKNSNKLKLSGNLNNNIKFLTNKINELYKKCYPVLTDIKDIRSKQTTARNDKESAKSFEKEDKVDIEYRANKADTLAIDWAALFDRIAKSQGGKATLTEQEISSINAKDNTILANVPNTQLFDTNSAFDLYLNVEWKSYANDAVGKLKKISYALITSLLALGFNPATNPLVAFLRNTLNKLDISSAGFEAIYEAYRKGDLSATDLKNTDIENTGNLIFYNGFYAIDRRNAELYLSTQKKALISQARTTDERLKDLSPNVFIKTLFTGDLLDKSKVLTTWGPTLVPVQTVITNLQTLFPEDAEAFVKKAKSSLNVDALNITDANTAALYITLISNIVVAENKSFDTGNLLKRYDYNFDNAINASANQILSANKKLAGTDINAKNYQDICDAIAEAGKINIIKNN